MPRSQTPVVSWVLAITSPGLLPSGASKPSAFLSVPLGEISLCPRLYPFRGSITRPASSLTPASYAHCWAGTWSSLLTCWLGVSQVGLEPEGSHPLGNNNQFHRISPTPKVSGLPWREQADVRPGSASAVALPPALRCPVDSSPKGTGHCRKLPSTPPRLLCTCSQLARSRCRCCINKLNYKSDNETCLYVSGITCAR